MAAVQSNFPFVATKLMIPRLRTGMVHRSRLVSRINQSIQRGLVLVSAPAGFGKTTLLVEWAAQNTGPVAWLSLDAQDNEPFLFFQYVLRAIQTVIPGFGKGALEFPQQPDTSEALLTGLTGLINECENQDGELTLVLDEYHFIENKTIHDGLNFFLEHNPPNLHLLVASRTDPPISLARRRAHNQVDEIRAADLRFTPEEAGEFLRRTMGLKLSDSQTSTLARRTEGWITGLQLAAISIQHQPAAGDPDSAISGNNTYILDFMVEEVFEQQPPETQEFLLRTSILDNLTGPLCDAVACPTAPDGHGQEMLHRFYHSNLFISSLDKEEHWFRYHPLFTESLRHLLAEKMRAEIPTLHQRACQWYDRHEFGEEAIKHALAAGDSLSAATIIEKNAEMVMKNGGILTILTWIQKLPEELVKAHPMLCIAYAWGLTMQFKPDLAEHWVNEALNSLPLPFDINTIREDHLPVISNSTDRDIVGQVYAVKSILAASRGNAGHSVELSKIALEFLSPDNLFYRSYVAYDQSINHILNGDVLQAQPALQETIRLSQAAGNWMLTMIARSSLGETYAMRGQLSKALATFEQSIPLAVDQSGDPVGFVGHLYIEIGEVYLERNDLLTAQHYITQGLELCKMWLPMLIELDGYYHLAHLKQCLGDHEAAQEEIAAMRRLAGDTESLLDDALISVYEIKLALLRGDLRTALSWAQQHGLLNEDLPQPPQDFPITLLDLVKVNLARIRIALAQREKQPQHADLALTVLDDLLPTITHKANVESLMEILVLQSLALQELERTDEALDKIRQAYALAEPEGYRRIFLDEGLPLARLTSRLLALQKKKADAAELPSKEYLSEMLRLFSAPAGFAGPDTSAGQAETPTHPGAENTAALDLLTPRELEVLRMVASGSSNAEIAQALFLALNTVKRHLNNVFLKLGVTTRVQAVAMARRLGIL